mmetsp:Transcript_8397/g.20943  ORF Transcript_8397/g.20943 Transcript_8397/m.20943 type:complete len:265 (-) Transcript_8397:228-1022(-)
MIQQRLQAPNCRGRAPRLACRPQRATRVAVSAGPMKVMIAGAPAAGKGTQCARILEKYNLVHISVGDLLRDQVKNGTPAGKKAKDFMDQGVLVPDEVVVEMVKSRLAQRDVEINGWLLDGYPRSASQAQAIEKEGIRPDVFLLIEVPDSILIDRVVGRRLDPVSGEIYHLKFKPPPKEIEGRLTIRSDDTEEKAKTRLQTHHSNVDAVLGYYKDITVKIDGNRSMDAVFNDCTKVLDAVLAKKDPLEEFCQQVPEADECRVYTD